MHPWSSLLKHLEPHIALTEEDRELFISVMEVREVKRKQMIEQPGFVSRYRTYVIQGAFRAFFIGNNGDEHTISLAIDDRFIGDPGSFLSQQPATLFVEAVEDSTIIQWSYASEKLMLKGIPNYAMFMMEKSQQTAVMLQRRVISHLNLSAEERYLEFMEKYPGYMQRFPLYIVASYLGMTREFLSKIRNQKSPTK